MVKAEQTAPVGDVLPTVERASGVMIYDTDGRDYLDASSGTICVNIGHGVPEVLDRIASQSAAVTFAHPTQFQSQPLTDLTATILSIAGPGFRDVAYSNSGSGAIETALRLMTHHHAGHRRRVIVSQRPSYHGVTRGALAISGHPPRRAGLDTLLGRTDDIIQVASSSEAILPSLADWLEVLGRVEPEHLAAVVLEPVGGAASGAVPVPAETLRGLRDYCDRVGALLIADEVMTGFGRVGDWFGVTESGITPDLLVTGKGLSGGYLPIGACLVGTNVLPGLSAAELSVGHTMSGNPLAAAAGLAVLEFTRDRGLVARAREVGEYLLRELQQVAEGTPCLGAPRGRGLLLALGIDQDEASFRQAPLNRQLVRHGLGSGLVLYAAGVDVRTQSVMVCPPLTISDDEVELLVERLAAATASLGIGA
jgi:hypothetical protein